MMLGRLLSRVTHSLSLLTLILIQWCLPLPTHSFSLPSPPLSELATLSSTTIASPKHSIHNHGMSTTTTQRQRSSLFNTASSTANDSSDGDNKSKEIKSKLTREFFQIALPAFIQLASEPLAALVDTAYLGRLGPEVLGGAGVAISAQYSVSKLYNDPLLRTSISLVASQDGKARGGSGTEEENSQESEEESMSVAVSSALLLAFTVGFIQLVIYASLASGIISSMGLTEASPMWYSALSYLRMRAFGTPAATLWLVTNGIFRGLGDTITPLVYAIGFTALNAILDPLFIFTFKFGASGAALGTLLAQYIALVPLMMALNKKVKINIFGQLSKLKSTLGAYLEAGGYVLFRTLGKVLAYAVCAREAALLGPIRAAAYNIMFQVGFATTQICEAVAVAVQTLLAREIADTSSPNDIRAQSIRHLVNGSICVGGFVSITLSLVTFLKRSSLVKSLSSNPEVQAACLAICPAVLITQVFKGLAYPVNGIIMGGLDWKFSMMGMWLANFVCIGLLKWSGIGSVMTLNKIWWSLAAFMAVQVVTGVARVESKTGVWKLFKKKSSA